MYRLIDLQGAGILESRIFKSTKEILEALKAFHDIDFSGTDDKDNELTIDEYFKFWNIKGTENQLNWLCEYGEWDYERINNCEHSFVDDDNNGIYGKEKCRKCGLIQGK